MVTFCADLGCFSSEEEPCAENSFSVCFGLCFLFVFRFLRLRRLLPLPWLIPGRSPIGKRAFRPSKTGRLPRFSRFSFSSCAAHQDGSCTPISLALRLCILQHLCLLCTQLRLFSARLSAIVDAVGCVWREELCNDMSLFCDISRSNGLLDGLVERQALLCMSVFASIFFRRVQRCPPCLVVCQQSDSDRP